MKEKVFLFITGVFFICSVASNIKAMSVTDWPPSSGTAATPQSPAASRPSVPVSPAAPAVGAAESSAMAADDQVEPIPLPIRGAPTAPARRAPPITDPNAPVVFSLIVKATVCQQIEIPFGGSGWVFLGEQNSQKGVTYTSHRLEAEGQSFVFSADKAGTYALKFYKQDFIRDYILNDNVQVIVSESPAATVSGHPAVGRSTVKATPRWPTAAQEAALTSGGLLPSAAESASAAQAATPGSGAVLQGTPAQTASASPQSPAAAIASNTAAPSPQSGSTADAATPAASPLQAADGLPADALPEEYLKKAQTTFSAGDIASTLSVLDKFRSQYPLGNDEAWWLYAQAFETNGPNKDIRSARDYYQRLVREYPLSPHYADAQSRFKYINKYYFNIQ